MHYFPNTDCRVGVCNDVLLGLLVINSVDDKAGTRHACMYMLYHKATTAIMQRSLGAPRGGPTQPPH